jgi:hypothetical protein
MGSTHSTNVTVHHINYYNNSNKAEIATEEGKWFYLCSSNPNFTNYMTTINKSKKNKFNITIKYKLGLFFNNIISVEQYSKSKYQKTGKYNCKTKFDNNYYVLYFHNIIGSFFISKNIFDQDPMKKNQLYNFLYDKTVDMQLISSYDKIDNDDEGVTLI